MKLLKIQLDWKAYFKRFCELHGEPVTYRGRLLFRDGWMYSKSDYAGPEWDPPEDVRELNQLRKAYWTIRQGKIKAERDMLKTQLQSLREYQHLKSMPLQRVLYTKVIGDDGGSRTVAEAMDLNMKSIELHLELLEEDLQTCNANLISFS